MRAMATAIMIDVLALCATPLAAAAGWYLGRREVPEGCVTWRRKDGFAPADGAERYETYVDVALPSDGLSRGDLILEIRIDGLADGDAVAVRRTPHPEESSANAASRSARVVERRPGAARIALPERPHSGARVAFWSDRPLGAAAVSVQSGPAYSIARPALRHEHVNGTTMLMLFVLLSATVRHVEDASVGTPRPELGVAGFVGAILSAFALLAGVAIIVHVQTLRWRSFTPLLRAAFGRDSDPAVERSAVRTSPG
jgi:hypothetical protein